MKFEQFSPSPEDNDIEPVCRGNPADSYAKSSERLLVSEGYAETYYAELDSRFEKRKLDRPELGEFRDLVSKESYAKANQYLARMEKLHQSRHGQGSQMIELMLLRTINDLNLIQPEVDDWVVSAGLSSKYDDIRNGVDVMVRFCRLDDSGEVAESFYVGIDTTTSSPDSNPDKSDKLSERLGYNVEHNQLNKAEFVRDPFEGDLAVNVEFANVVVGYDVGRLEGLSKAIKETRDELSGDTEGMFRKELSQRDLDLGESEAYRKEQFAEGVITEMYSQLDNQQLRHEMAGNWEIAKQLKRIRQVLVSAKAKKKKGATIVAPRRAFVRPVSWTGDAQA